MLKMEMGIQELLKINSETYNEKLIKVNKDSDIIFFSGSASENISIIPRINRGVIFVRADNENVKLINTGKLDGVNYIEGKNIRYAGIYTGIYDMPDYDEEKVTGLFNIIIEETDFTKQCQILETSDIKALKCKNLCSILQICRQGDELVKIIDEIIKSNGRRKISELAEMFDYSVRHFYRIFSEGMDISPKLYMRILRCSIVINRMTENPGCEITEYMESLGYFDQSHFQHEFKWFTGMTPKNFLKKISI